MTFEEFLQAELEELLHWSNDPELQFEPSYISRMRRVYNAAKPKWQPIETFPVVGDYLVTGGILKPEREAQASLMVLLT